MIGLDQYIVEFVGQNWIALSLLLGVLKIIAKATPWVGDDALLTLFSGVFAIIRGKNPTTQARAERGEFIEGS